MRLEIARRARSDLAEIRRFTREHWGAAQEARYLSSIEDKFRLLTRHPEMGPIRADVSPVHRMTSIGRHVIVYRIEGDTVRIARILHQNMDIAEHLSDS